MQALSGGMETHTETYLRVLTFEEVRTSQGIGVIGILNSPLYEQT